MVWTLCAGYRPRGCPHVQAMQRMSEWREGVYVRLYGNMTEFEGNFRLLAYIVRKVTDFNEVCSIPTARSQNPVVSMN